MTTKIEAEKLNGKGMPKMEVKKTTIEKVTKATKPVKELTKEDLQKQVQQLTAKLQAVPQDLNSRIEYFNNKKELIRKLGGLEANTQNLQTHLDEIAEVAASNDFQTDEFILTIEGGGKYNRKQIFALQNPVLIGEVITYLLGKMEAKVIELKKQIEA